MKIFATSGSVLLGFSYTQQYSISIVSAQNIFVPWILKPKRLEGSHYVYFKVNIQPLSMMHIDVFFHKSKNLNFLLIQESNLIDTRCRFKYLICIFFLLKKPTTLLMTILHGINSSAK